MCLFVFVVCVCLVVLPFLFLFFCLIKKYREVVLNKTSSDSVIPAVTHRFIKYYVRYRMYTYPLKRSWLLVYVFITQLGKITERRKPPVASVHLVRKYLFRLLSLS